MSGFDQGAWGADDTRQLEVNLVAQFDRKTALALWSQSADDRGVYPIRSESDLSIRKDDVVFRLKQDKAGVQHIVKILSSLQGLGTRALELYPTNQKMQVESVMNEILILGTAFDDIDFAEKAMSRVDLSYQVHGIHTGKHAKVAMPQGLVAEYCARTLDEIENQGISGYEPNRTTSFVGIDLRPVDSQLAGERIVMHIREILYNVDSWKSAMNPQHRSTSAWLAMADSFYKFGTMAGLLFMSKFGPYLLSSFGVDVFPDPLNPSVMDSDIKKQLENRLVILASRLKILDQETSVSSLYDPGRIADDNLRIQRDDEVEELHRQFQGSLWADGQIKELLFGFDANDPDNIKGLTTESFDRSDPYGNFISKQINTPSLTMAGVLHATRKTFELRAGIITRGVNAGEKFSWKN